MSPDAPFQLLAVLEGDLGAPGTPVERLGRRAANVGWLAAYLRYGAADEVILLGWEDRQREAFIDEAVRRGVDPARASFRHVLDLPDLLARLPRPVFFLGEPLVHRVRADLLRAAPGPGWRTPVAGITHTLSTAYVLHGLREMVLGPLAPWDAVACTSRSAESLVRRAWDEEARAASRPPVPALLERIPLGIFPEPGAGEPPAPPSPAPPPGRPVVLVHGRLSLPDKMDLVGLIERWPRVRDAVSPRPVLVLSGAAAHRPTIELYRERITTLRLGEDVLLCPDVPPAGYRWLLDRADVFCSPADNQQETFGLAVVEAMAAGLPVVVSDWDGYRDLVRDGDEGFLVPTVAMDTGEAWTGLVHLLPDLLRGSLFARRTAVDLGRLEEALVRLLRDPALRERMGAAGRRRVAAEFSWERVIPRWDDLFRRQRALVEREPAPAPPAPPPGPAERFLPTWPARLLDAETRLRVTAAGAAALSGRERPFLHLPPRGYERVLSRLRLAAGPAGRSLAEIEADLADDPDLLPVLRATVLWLLKRGWLELA